MFKIALVAFALIAASEAVVRSCDRGVTGPLPVEIRITGCPDNTATCRIIRGGTISGEMDFVTTSTVATLTPEITAYAFGVRAVYVLPEDRRTGCNWLLPAGTRCPLSNGEFSTYELFMPILEEYPLTTLDIEVRLFDQNGLIQLCVLIESEVVLA